MLDNKFEQRAPSAQTAVDIFKGRWASNVGEIIPGVSAGPHPLFKQDVRPKQAAAELGRDGRLEGLRVLELGPLEGAHSYQLHSLGAKVTAVEANAEAYLKCLILKEIANLDGVRFLFGDCVEFLESTKERWDIVFCSGILYHMNDPVKLIKLCAEAADKCFIWTHYFDKDLVKAQRTPHRVERFGFSTTYYESTYADRAKGTFWGGNDAAACWMTREDIIAAFEHFGMKSTVIKDDKSQAVGPCITFAASK
jgi:hypothetical protein